MPMLRGGLSPSRPCFRNLGRVRSPPQRARALNSGAWCIFGGGYRSLFEEVRVHRLDLVYLPRAHADSVVNHEAGEGRPIDEHDRLA